MLKVTFTAHYPLIAPMLENKIEKKFTSQEEFNQYVKEQKENPFIKLHVQSVNTI